MSEPLELHREIEKAMVTSGRDIGRVKDVDLAHDLAHVENTKRLMLNDPEDIVTENTDSETREVIAARAVQKKAGIFLSGLARTGLAHDKSRIGPEGLAHVQEQLIREAEIVGEEYNTLQRAAKRENGEYNRIK